ncbi:MAG: hypothetical protein ACRDP4_15545, partial [Nocardioidaceae bacterium]
LRLPVPRHALQGSYHSAKSRPAQVVVLQFGSVPAATRYFRGFTRMLRACDRADGPGGVRVEPTRVRSESFLGRRHYVGARTWWEVDVRVGARVGVLLASDTIADQPAVARVLARAIRR